MKNLVIRISTLVVFTCVNSTLVFAGTFSPNRSDNIRKSTGLESIVAHLGKDDLVVKKYYI